MLATHGLNEKYIFNAESREEENEEIWKREKKKNRIKIKIIHQFLCLLKKKEKRNLFVV